MKPTSFLIIACAVLTLTACSPEDRSSEQPFPPTVETHSPIPQENAILLQGDIKASPNSRITKRGFRYGIETLQKSIDSTDSTDLFSATLDSLDPGTYHVAAYATNGVGTSYGDTLQFVVE